VSGKTELKPVLDVLRHTATELVTIKLTDAKTGKTAQTLSGTTEHLFFTPGGKMVAMGDLRVGQQIVSRDGETLVVQAEKSRHVEEGISVYNLTVEGDHTYFVGAADGGEWVHNGCFTAAEESIANYLRDLGRTVSKNPLEGMPGAGRQADAYVDGVLHEFKTLDPGAASGRIKNVVSESLKGGGQARNLIIDARGSGLSLPEAQRGIRRALGAAPGKLDRITIIGDDYFWGAGP